MSDKTLVMKCNKCGNRTVFKLLSEYEAREYEQHKHFGKIVYITHWKFLQCQSCLHPTLHRADSFSQIYDDGEEGYASPSKYWPKHGEEVNNEDL